MREPKEPDDDGRLRIQALSALKRRNEDRPDLPAVADTEAWITGYIRRERLNPTDVGSDDGPPSAPLCGGCTNGWVELDDGDIERCECRGGPARALAPVYAFDAEGEPF